MLALVPSSTLTSIISDISHTPTRVVVTSIRVPLVCLQVRVAKPFDEDEHGDGVAAAADVVGWKPVPEREDAPGPRDG